MTKAHKVILDSKRPFELPWTSYFQNILSIWDVKTYLASRLMEISRDTIQLYEAAKGENADWPVCQAQMRAALTEIISHCEFMSLKMTGKQASRCLRDVEKALPGEDWCARLDDLEMRFNDEIEGLKFVFVEPKNLELYESIRPFGDDVFSQFANSRKDTLEAARCLGLDRYDASVFHCVKAVEWGLIEMHKAMTGAEPLNLNWSALIKGIEDEIKTRDSAGSRSTQWQQERDFYVGAAVHFRYLKDSLRNYVAHATKVSYERDQAEVVFEHAKQFLQHLATKLRD